MTDLIPFIDFSQAIQDATGQLGKRSRRIYENDAKMLALWLQEQGASSERTYSLSYDCIS